MRLAHPAGVFEIESLPSQPQVAHCHAFFVYPKMRGKGLGHVLKKFQMSTMHYLGYDYAICSWDARFISPTTPCIRMPAESGRSFPNPTVTWSSSFSTMNWSAK